MDRLRGWGWLLAIAFPLLIYFSWAQLNSQASRKQLERFQNTVGPHAEELANPLQAFFKAQGRVAVAGDVQLPVPAQSGIKQMVLKADGVLQVEIDAQHEGKPLVLHMVPVVFIHVQGAGVAYDCLSESSSSVVLRSCRAETVRSLIDVPKQLAANLDTLKSAPLRRDATGTAVAAGAALGSAFFAPEDPAKIGDCGYACIKPLSCANERALLCQHKATQEVISTIQLHRGTNIATAQDAQKICQDLNADYQLAKISDTFGKLKLQSGGEYWVHAYDEKQNCWTGKLTQ